MRSRATGNDQQFLESFKRGEEQAFDQLYRQYFVSLSYFANSIIHHSTEAEDIVQDCFVTLWKRRSKLQHIQDIKNYLYTSIRYQCIRVLQKRKKQLNEADSSIEEINVEKGIIAAEVAQEIYQLINTLAPGMQQVIRLYYLEGKSYSEIARILGIDAESVRKSKYRALLTLRKTNITLS